MRQLKPYLRLLPVAIVVALLAMSCSESPSKQTDGVPISFQMVLPKAGGLEQLVDTVVLRIYSDDFDTMTFGLPVVQGGVSMTLDVPPGTDRIFEMEARDASERILYAGADTADVGSGLDQQVHILLKPVILLMRLSPLYQEVSVGGQGDLGVYIHNVDSLYGAAFRIEFDPNLIQIDGASAGNFLDGAGDILFFTKSVAEEGYYAIGISRTRPESGDRVGVSGSGELANIKFTALSPSEAEIRLVVDFGSGLQKPDGMAVNGLEGLALDGATVHVRGTE
jgi:hypothetical protein